MTIKTFFLNFVDWLKSPEVFGNISKKIPGKWLLFEYYIDSEETLLNFTEEDLKKHNQSLFTEILSDESFHWKCNLPVSLFQNMEAGKWSRTKNYITFIQPDNFRDNVEFQFAFEKGNLKLLKKDAFGKIEFFGFFKKLNSGS